MCSFNGRLKYSYFSPFMMKRRVNSKRGTSSLVVILILLIISSAGGYITYSFVFNSAQIEVITERGNISIEDASLVKQTDVGTVFSITLKNVGEKPIKTITVNLAGTNYEVPLKRNLQARRTVSFVETDPASPDGGFTSGNKYTIIVTATMLNGGTFVKTSTVTCLGGGISEQGGEEKYAVAFSQTGLPDGTEWSVTFGEETKSSMESTITFNVKAGTYEWSVQTIEVSDTRYAPSPSSDTLDVPVQTEQETVFSTQYKLTVFVPDDLRKDRGEWRR